jgi:hypothetical protein
MKREMIKETLEIKEEIDHHLTQEVPQNQDHIIHPIQKEIIKIANK